MRISYSWLKNYVDTDMSPEELSVLLTDSGLEVESLERYEAVRGGLKGVVTGKVVSCEPHPNADKLSLARVDVGGDDTLPIVCGAPNVAKDQKVVVALVGSTLHTPKGELPIKKAKIRGEVSEGMICAEDELGLGDSHEGIMVLPEGTAVGMPAAEYFDITSDWVYEIGLTPNRIDGASHIGAARDVAAVLAHRQKAKKPVLWPDVSGFKADNDKLIIPVTIEDPEACPRYSSLTISTITVKESPRWLKDKLMALGLKPINNVVDVTNFVLHEMGQPLHAFDVDAITGSKVIVKKSPEGTVFETLDAEKLELTGHDLMICNVAEPMCMGGILGGTGSGVTENTTRVFLESACFDPVTIRKSAKHHGLKTEASFRFERGSDPAITIYALKRAAMLIKEVAGGEITSDVQDVYPKGVMPVEVDLTYDRINGLIGKEIPEEEIKSILESLDFKIVHEAGRSLRVAVPTYRVDVTRDADVIEEILRIYGYNHIEVPQKMETSIVISPSPDKEAWQNTIADMLSARGFHEIMNNSLTKGAYYEGFGFAPNMSVPIVNPLSQDLNVMRQSLIFGALETIAYNKNRKMHDLKLYEFGKLYARQAVEPGADPLRAYRERLVLGVFMTGNRQEETWYEEEAGTGFFELKNALMSVFRRFGLREEQLTLNELKESPRFAYGVDVYHNKKHLARMGLLAQNMVKSFDVEDDVFYGMISWDELVAMQGVRNLQYEDVPRFPAMRRDFALLLNKDVPFAAIQKIAFNMEKKILREVSLFDVFEDEEKLGKGKKSYAVRFGFQHPDRTLKDKEVDKIMEKLARAYEKELGASIR